MKTIITIAILLTLCAGTPASADPNYSVVGALLGATAGMVIGHNVDGISREFAVPVLAITGGIIGHQYGIHRNEWDWRRSAWDDRRHHGYDRYDRWNRRDPWDRRGPWDRHHGYSRYDRNYYYPVAPKAVPARTYTPRKADPRNYATPDTQPGVDLLKVQIINRSGIRSDVPVLRVNDQYIGPQGEVYKTLPTAQELARRYRM